MGKPIHASDIRLLASLWGPDQPHIKVVDELGLVQGESPMRVVGKANVLALVSLEKSSQEFSEAISHYDLVLDFTGRMNQFGQLGSSMQSKSGGIDSHESIEFSYINNPSGSMRWLFPRGDRSGDFLRFYNISGFRAWFIATMIRIVVKLGLYSLVSGEKFRVYCKKDRLTEPFTFGTFRSASIFTGTPGNNRKVVMLDRNAEGEPRFSKVAVGPNSAKLIDAEHQTLEQLGNFKFRYLEIPKVTEYLPSRFIRITDVRPIPATRSRGFTGLHALALQELSAHSSRWQPIASSGYLKRVYEQLDPGPGEEDSRLVFLISLIRRQLSELRPEMQIVTARAHADFTPWNCYLSYDKLAIYDWEQSQTDMPLLFDLFHYIIQTEIILGQPEKIPALIEEALQQREVVAMIRYYGINPALYQRLYLIGIAAHWLNKYRFGELRREEIKQIQCWINMLQDTPPQISRDNRPAFLEALERELKVLDAAPLKFRADSLVDLSVYSDLDLLVSKPAASRITTLCKGHRLVKRVRTYKAPGMVNLDIDFHDGENLSLDLIHSFCRKNIIYLPVKTFLADAVRDNNGMLRLQPEHEFAYIACFYMLNRAGVPDKYLEYFDEQGAEAKAAINNYLRADLRLKVPDFRALEIYNPDLRADFVQQLLEHPQNGLSARIKNGLNYAYRAMLQPFGRRGFIVTLSGADGAGKSTIVAELNRHIRKKWRRKTVMLRHRPGILPMMNGLIHGEAKAKQMAKERLPRQGKNKSLLSSLIRFTYYYIDYFFGQVYIYFKYVLRGYVVIYDRYFFDFIVDPKRSNLAMGGGLPMFMYRFLMKPRYNFFLDAPAEVILSRKQELRKEDIEGLHSRYRQLFAKLSSKSRNTTYQVVQNIEVPNTVETILNECKKRA